MNTAESTPEIRARESSALRTFLVSLSRPDRRIFITDVIRHLKVERKTFYNWQYGQARLPTHAKAAIEQIAGYKVFLCSCPDEQLPFTPSI